MMLFESPLGDLTCPMLDPLAYRRHLLARFLQIAGAGSAGLAVLSAVDCGARTNLGVGSHASLAAGSGTGGAGGFGGGTGSGGASTSATTEVASATSGFGGFGGGTVGVGVGGAPIDAGVTQGSACIASSGDTCPSGDQAVMMLDGALGPCTEVIAILGPPSADNGLCCYEVIVQSMPCYVGRTFFIDEGVVKAELRRGASWRAGPAPDVSRLPRATRLALADAWARDGLFEHASVASFSRFAMQLLALGAPAELVRDVHAGALDEIRHAELCLGLSSGYLGESVEPGALPMPGPIAIVPDLAAVAAEAVMEGCIGETVATVQAVDALAVTTDAAVREVLEITVADETRHAELSWRFLAWALDQGGAPVREAVLAAFASFRPAQPRVEALEGVDLGLYAAHGRQRAVEGRAIAERVMAEIIQPAMCVLLSRRQPGSRDVDAPRTPCAA
jgi:hypothetical protein